MRFVVLTVASVAMSLHAVALPAVAAAPTLRASLLAAPHSPMAAGVIVGRVTDKETGEALTGVSVTVNGTKLGSVTDDNGRYRIAGVAEGSQGLTARRLGYGVATRQVTVTSGEITADFTMSKAIQ